MTGKDVIKKFAVPSNFEEKLSEVMERKNINLVFTMVNGCGLL